MNMQNHIDTGMQSVSYIPGKYNPGCVVYLVRDTPADIGNFVRSLELLRKNYLSKFPCPVFAYHETLTENDTQGILQLSNVNVEFRKVTFRAPDGTPPDLSGRALGYRHMCHFFGNDVFRISTLFDFEYYMRLDTDSFILSPIKYDLFEHMKKYNLGYGYITAVTDNPKYTVGLWKTAEAYLSQYPELRIYRKLETIPDGRCYYTNFEICRLPWFRRDPNSGFFDYLDKINGIYTTRWGDHTIRYLSVNLFMPPEQIYQFRDLHYRHQKEYKPGISEIR